MGLLETKTLAQRAGSSEESLVITQKMLCSRI